MFVITIIAQNFINDILAEFQQYALQQAIDIKSYNWLNSDSAIDFFIDIDAAENSAENMQQSLKKLCQDVIKDKPYDFIIQDLSDKYHKRQKKMLISDMDSTIIEQECIDELADYLGIKQQISDITERAMKGELDFAESLKTRVALLKDLPISVMSDIYKNNIKFTKGAKQLLNVTNEHAKSILVSGGFTVFTELVKKDLGFHYTHANRLAVRNETLTGQLIMPVLDHNSKAEILNDYLVKFNLDKDDVIAIGDGANDIPMLNAVNMGVAFRAKSKVLECTNNHISHNYLEAILYMQGYNKF
ncbi:MAG: phosphoserine phosphatase SerB [Pseudomonadota bacterium]